MKQKKRSNKMLREVKDNKKREKRKFKIKSVRNNLEKK